MHKHWTLGLYFSLFLSVFLTAGTPAFSQDVVADDSQKIHVMVIDGDNPDWAHPWFYDQDGHSVIRPVDPFYIHEGLPYRADPISPLEPYHLELTQEQLLKHWAARFHLGWTDSALGKFIHYVTEWKRLAAMSFVVAAGMQWWAHPDMPWTDILSASKGPAWNYFINTWILKGIVPVTPYLWFLVTYPVRRWMSKNPDAIDPKYNIPMIMYRTSGMRHATHVTGTIVGNGESEQVTLKKDLVVHTLSFSELGLSDSSFQIGPLRQLRQFIRKGEKIADQAHGPRSAASRRSVRDFLEEYASLQRVYFVKLVKYINENNIRAANMSYGADSMGLRKALAAYFRSRDALNLGGAEKVGEFLARLQNESYQYLFRNCPNTAFFIAAGNDASPVHRSTELFTAIDEPNVFVGGAADKNLRMAFFSNYSEQLTDSFGFGMDQHSSLPKGRQGRLSGTSMASPHLMSLDVMLLRLDPTLSIAERFSILRSGSVKVAELAEASNSHGFSVPHLVVAQYLLHKIKKRGHLQAVDDLAPLVVVHDLEKPLYRRAWSRKTAKPKTPAEEVAWKNNGALIKQAPTLLQATTAALDMVRSRAQLPAAQNAEALARYCEEVHHVPHVQIPGFETAQTFEMSKDAIELLAAYLHLLETGEVGDPLHGEVERSLVALNTRLVELQAPLMKYFVTPDDDVVPGTRFHYRSGESRMTWAEFKEQKLLGGKAAAEREVLFEISQFLAHGQRLTRPEAQELVDLLIANKHRFNAVLYVLQNILHYSGHDLEFTHPTDKQRYLTSEYIGGVDRSFPPIDWIRRHCRSAS